MTHHTICGGRAPGLDLLRAGAIVTVMLYHLASHGFALDGFGHMAGWAWTCFSCSVAT